METDLLTDVLRTVQLQSAVLYRGHARAPFGLTFAPQAEAADACFHVLTEGRCLLTVEETGESRWLEKGDFVLLPHGHTHSLRDSEGTPAYPIGKVGPSAYEERDGTKHFGPGTPPQGGTHGVGGGAAAAVICGRFVLQNRETNPLLRALPPVLLVRGEQGKSVPWLEFTLAAIACEVDSGRPGAETVIIRLADILFIQAIRAHLAQLPTCERGWLRAMADERIGPSLAAIHQNPAHGWTVAELARVACLSRSAFAARFQECMGEPPLAYVTRWRIHRAADLLKNTRLPVARIAARVGYGSEAAFNKVYKRWTGETPGRSRGLGSTHP